MTEAIELEAAKPNRMSQVGVVPCNVTLGGAAAS